MGTTGFDFGKLGTVSIDGLREDSRPGERHLEHIDDDSEDGPMPWWSGFVWLPLVLFAALFFVGCAYSIWAHVF